MPSIAEPTHVKERETSILLWYALLIFAAIVLRTLFTAPVEQGGDALQKWELVGRLLDGETISIFLENHHTARWAINLPTLAFASGLGFNWTSYYIAPMFFFLALLLLAAFFLKRNGFGIFTYTIFIVILFADPMYMRATSQLVTFVFVAPFVMAHAIFLQNSIKNPSKMQYFLAALFMFLAYGAKETALFYVPASCAYVIWAIGWRRGLRTLLWIGAFGVAFVVIETTVISILAGEVVPTGRLALLDEHFDRMDAQFNDPKLPVFLYGWRNLPLYTAVLFGLAALCGSYLIYLSIRAGRPDPLLIPVFFFVSFALVQTFAIKSIDPLVPALPGKPKYLADLVPWACLTISAAVTLLLNKLRDAKVAQSARIIAISLAMIVLLVGISQPRQYRGTYPIADAWMWHADESWNFVGQLALAGVPIVDPRKGRSTRKSGDVLRSILGVEFVTIPTKGGHSAFIAVSAVDKAAGAEICISGNGLLRRLELLPCQLELKGGRVMKSWGETRRFQSKPTKLQRFEENGPEKWVSHVTHAARIGQAPARFARLVADDPTLSDYQPAARTFLVAIAEALTEFNEDCVSLRRFVRKSQFTTDGCWYRRPMDGRPEPTNHIHDLGEVLIELENIDKSQIELELAISIQQEYNIFKEEIKEFDDGTVYWKYYKLFSTEEYNCNRSQHSKCIWKASQTIRFVYRAYDGGYDAPESLISAIARTFLTHVIRRDQVIGNLSPIESQELNASDEKARHIHRIVSWLRLAEYEPEIADRVRHLVAARPDLFKGGWLSSPNSSRGFAHFLEAQRT